MQQNLAIEMENISKVFGSLKANNNVNLSVRKGEVHALLGENGAGKSTLMNMLSGIYTPDTGSIKIDGQEVHFASPKDSIRLGIGMIHQHFKLVDVMTAKENIIIGQPSGFFVKGKLLSQEVKKLSDQYGLDIDPDKKVYDMSVGEKQTLEIIKVLYRGAKILIMDEPTAVLTPQEIKKLFRVIRNMKEQGCSVVIITHKLNEVMEISDRVTVLRKGESIGTVNTGEVNVASLIEMMVGKKVDLSIDKKKIAEKTPLLDLDEVTVLDGEGKEALANVSFSVKPGERIGIIGRSGSGKSTLARLVMGFYEPAQGQLLLDGLDLRQLDVADLRHQIGYVAHDLPLLAGSLRDNLTLGARYISDARMLEVAELTGVTELARQHPQGFDRPVGERGQLLSGGQRQAVLLARALLLDPPIMLLDEPTSAMDNSSEDALRQKLHTWIQGKTLLLVTHRTSMLSLVDRLVVLDNGRIVADGPKEAVIDALRKGRLGVAYVRFIGFFESTWLLRQLQQECRSRVHAGNGRRRVAGFPTLVADYRVAGRRVADQRVGLGQVRGAAGSHHGRRQGDSVEQGPGDPEPRGRHRHRDLRA